MRILAISDVEEKILWDRFDMEKWQGIDLIISCGDLKSDYLQFLVTMLRVPVFYVRGNHDVEYSGKPPEGCDDIDRRFVSYKGLRFVGLEGSMWYNGQPHQYTEFQMMRRAMKLWIRMLFTGGVDIIITHAPPKGIHDATDICHKGFKIFNRLIGFFKPQVFLHGHTHLGYYRKRERVSMSGQTKVIDVYGHYVLDIEPRRK